MWGNRLTVANLFENIHVQYKQNFSSEKQKEKAPFSGSPPLAISATTNTCIILLVLVSK